MTASNPDDRIDQIVAESLAAGDPTGWFERLYMEAERGEATVPWDRASPHWSLVDWAERRNLTGAGRRALVVGCGLGDDAAFVSSLGFDTVAFDIAPTAVRAAQRRFPEAGVDYLVANLLDPPGEWTGGFDLVVESQTIQALPVSLRLEAIANVAGFVAPGGTLIVLAAAAPEGTDRGDDPPWPLTRSEVERFASHGLLAVDISEIPVPGEPDIRRWSAQFRRPG
jgi:SAM-dependent methyltransferase